jgi:hypothetical protein
MKKQNPMYSSAALASEKKERVGSAKPSDSSRKVGTQSKRTASAQVKKS